jgi:pimeloyl-ACP methyl ester carboxylesterase
LCIQQAYALAFAGRLGEATAALDQVEPSRCNAAQEGGIELAQDALAALPADASWDRAVAYWALGFAQHSLGSLDAARDCFSEQIRLARAMGNVWTLVTGLTDLAQVLRSQGELNAARALYEEALQAASSQGARGVGYIARMEAGLAAVLYEQNELRTDCGSWDCQGPHRRHLSQAGCRQSHGRRRTCPAAPDHPLNRVLTIPTNKLASIPFGRCWLQWLAGNVDGGRQYDMRLARQQIAGLSSLVVETECGPIEYATRGEDYPVLSIHRNGGGFDQGLGFAAGYLGAGFRVIAPSRFGYLRTPLPAEATPELQADAYACLLDALGIERAGLITTSAGVTSAIQFALRHPQRVSGMALLSPNAPGEVDMALPPRGVLNGIFHSDCAWWVMVTYLRPLTQHFVGVPSGLALTPALTADVQAALSQVSPISLRGDGIIFDTFVGNSAIKSSYPFEHISVPVLVVSAVDDPMALHANARTLAERIPGARLVVIPDGGHLMLGHTGRLEKPLRALCVTLLSIALPHAPARKPVRGG